MTATRHFDEELNQLKDKLLTMASYAEKSLRTAVDALIHRDDNLADQVEETDSIIDRLEMENDDFCIHLLALQSPMASDLRLITMGIKIVNDLERVGDEATTIARRARELNHEPPLDAAKSIPEMANITIKMLNDSLSAFVSRDISLARAVIKKDLEVDALNKSIHKELLELMLNDKNCITRCLNLMVISKSLERIADHATNLAEEVVYLLEGKDIRHSEKFNKLN